MSKQTKVEFLNAENLDNIKTIIKLRQEEPIRLMNFVTVKLFWEIGLLLHNDLESHDDKTILNSLSEALVESYGNFFCAANLDIMLEFSLRCDEDTLKKIASYIDWKFIPMLLTLKSSEEWIFYTRLIIQEKLNLVSLKEQINAKRFVQSERSALKFPDFPFHDLKITNNKAQVLPIENFFKEPLLNDFRLLFEPNNKRSTAAKKDLSPVTLSLFNKIAKKITNIRDQFNSHFNLRFNLSLWEIGSEINRLYTENEVANLEEFIKQIDKNLVSFNSSLFNSKSLFIYHLFAEQFERQKQILLFAELLKWEHILVLLRIINMQEKLFYALIAIQDNLNGRELQQMVEKDVYKNPLTDNRSDKIKSQLSNFLEDEALLNEFDSIAADLIKREKYNQQNNIFMNDYFLDFVRAS